jgi:hypothetical protein
MTLVIVVATPPGLVAATVGGLDDAGIVVLGVDGAPASGTGGDDHGTARGSSAIGASSVPPAALSYEAMIDLATLTIWL